MMFKCNATVCFILPLPFERHRHYTAATHSMARNSNGQRHNATHILRCMWTEKIAVVQFAIIWSRWVRTISTKKEIEIQLVCIKCPAKHRVQLTKPIKSPTPARQFHSEETHATILIDVNRIFDRNSAINESINRANWPYRQETVGNDAWNYKFISLHSWRASILFFFRWHPIDFGIVGQIFAMNSMAGRTFHSHLIFDWRIITGDLFSS